MTEELKSLKDWGCICQTIKVFSLQTLKAVEWATITIS